LGWPLELQVSIGLLDVDRIVCNPNST